MPKAKKITTSDNFEDAYLRLGYAKNVNKDIPLALFKIHERTVSYKSFVGFMANKSMSMVMGFEKEDFESVARFHLASYLSSMSLLIECKARQDFIQTYKKRHGEFAFPTDEDFVKKDISNFMAFVGQRMSDLNRVVVQKAQNVFGSKVIRKLYRMSPIAKEIQTDVFISMDDSDLAKQGYYAVTKNKERDIIKKAGGKYRVLDTFEVDGEMYRKVFHTPEMFTYLEDISFDWANLEVATSPREAELENRKEAFMRRYIKSPHAKKVKMMERLTRYLEKNSMGRELQIANKMLAELRK